MNQQIDFQKVLKYMGEKIATLEMDMAIKNAYIDQQGEHIKMLETHLELLQSGDGENTKGNTSAKIIDLSTKDDK